MVKKLRKRVCIYTILAVAIVLTLLMGIINTANYVSKIRSADEILAVLAENDGQFPLQGIFAGGNPGGPMGRPGDNTAGNNAPGSGGTGNSDAGNGVYAIPEGEDPNDYYDDDTDFDEDVAAPGQEGGFEDAEDAEDEYRKRFGDFDDDDIRAGMSMETPFETRFFTVRLHADGTEAGVDTGRIAAVSRETAITMAKDLQASGKTRGFSGNYRFLVKETETNDTMFLFVDCTRDLLSFRSFLRTSLLVSLAGLLAIAILVIIFSPLMVRPVAESYEKQKTFIANAGHEIKTPLSVIGSCTEVIEMENGESKWTRGIHEQVERLGTLTQELMTLARMDETAADELKVEEIDLSELAQKALSPFSLMAEQSGHTFVTDITPGIRMKGNRSMLTELFSILGDNAIKYAAPGEIRFSLAQRGHYIFLVSTNAAEGLKPGKQNQLFDRFYRGDSSRSQKAGYGIGLSMASSIVAAHGGTISAVSPEGKRLLITAKLPA
ncbi:MAG: HAMP domain-containing histidine kinase [Clostridia bacterium]|nr:HAMP domain-containing histidine kinase [Clostridia bacterium]